jgi:hypothetical protein
MKLLLLELMGMFRGIAEEVTREGCLEKLFGWIVEGEVQLTCKLKVGKNSWSSGMMLGVKVG